VNSVPSLFRRVGCAWPCAAASAFAVAGILTLERLPPSADFILPRRAGFGVFRAAMRVADSPVLRTSVVWSAAALIGLCALILLWRAVREVGAEWLNFKSRGLPAALGAGAFLGGLLVLAWAFRFCASLWVDIVQNAWFAPESVDWREPLCTFAALWVAAAAGLKAAGSLLRWTIREGAPARSQARRAAFFGGGLLLAGLALYGWGCWRYDLRRGSLAEAARLSSSRPVGRTILVLAEKRGRPEVEARSLEYAPAGKTDFSSESLAAVERYASGPRTVFTLPALRWLYWGYTIEMRAEDLRRALLLGHRLGDPLARLLLLESLIVAPPGPQTAGLLDSLADERRYRIGTRAAARMAIAYARLGMKERSAYWERRAALGEGGIPLGLLPLPRSQGALSPGLLRGRVRGARLVRVGLYARGDRYAPYELGPGQLVASASVDRRGRFSFRGLGAGDYFLALVFDSPSGEGRQARLSGHRGDIRLDARRPSLVLPELAIRR